MATGRYLVVVPEMIGRHFCRHYPLRLHQLEPAIPIVYLMAGHPLSAHDEAIGWFRGCCTGWRGSATARMRSAIPRRRADHANPEK